MEPKTTGVVLLHGKRFEPAEMAPMAEALRAARFLVETPEVPWSARRLYDRTPQEANEEIAATAARLRQAGAQRLVIGGHSSGGAGALRCAAVAHNVAALVLVAPAPVVEGDNFHRRIASQLAQAQALIDAGQGDKMELFDDFNSIGESQKVMMSAKMFLAYNAPDGPAAMSRAAPAIGSIPILWIAPMDDPGVVAFEKFIVPKLSYSARLTRVDVAGGHMDAPSEAIKPVVDWLIRLK
jgi:pimeloyl-ACP methyl ester carboxylesterase